MDNVRIGHFKETPSEAAAESANSGPIERKYLDIDGASAYLKCSKRTIYKLCALRKLAYHEGAGLRWFLKSDLDDYISSGRVGIYGAERRRRKSA
ncbi:MAG TPA: helix-turn-helix domain-containing protein [Candidatus Baltobacteraceae bacterium]|jgi:excisionase family DNA binding protein|nr:helix-turn-helix domain-containing protein [Candidatus Baltobacteraceae bacterium]